MKTLKKLEKNAILEPNKVMGGLKNIGDQELPTLADLYPTGLISESLGLTGTDKSGDIYAGDL